MSSKKFECLNWIRTATHLILPKYRIRYYEWDKQERHQYQHWSRCDSRHRIRVRLDWGSWVQCQALRASKSLQMRRFRKRKTRGSPPAIRDKLDCRVNGDKSTSGASTPTWPDIVPLPITFSSLVMIAQTLFYLGLRGVRTHGSFRGRKGG